MDKIKIKIDGRVAKIESAPEVVTDNAEYEVEFAVNERDGWNLAVPMTALFVRRDAKYTAVVMEAGETTCAMQPQTGTSVVYIGLTQEEMRTTTPARIAIRRSVRTMTDFPPLPNKDVYAQILANFAGLRMLSGKGAPTTETPGKVNQLYRDEENNRIYVCVDDADGYTWAMVSGGGGGGGTVVTIDTTLTKAGQAADAKAVGDKITEVNGKVEDKLDATALPTAVNNALAQAKASGAFDGAKGEKGDPGEDGQAGTPGQNGVSPHIGTNGNWWIGTTDTGVSATGGSYTLPVATPDALGGVKPIGKTAAMTQDVGVDADGKLYTAPSGGGTDKSLGIASATVGQIAKITAVDGTGKPTGWEPVDMPTVSGGYELVFQETVAEDVRSYSRDTDKDGNPFSLTDVMVVIFTRPFAESTNTGGRALGFLPTSKWGQDCVTCDIGGAISSDVPNAVGRYSVVFAKVVNGYQVVTRAYISHNTTNVFGVLMRQTAAGNEMFTFRTDATKLMQIMSPQGNMTCVKIDGYSNPLISAGTIIALYKKERNLINENL